MSRVRFEKGRLTISIGAQWRAWGLGFTARFDPMYSYLAILYVGPFFLHAWYDHDDSLPF